MPPARQSFERLTPRECLVCQLLVDGLSCREIAVNLCRSDETIKTHVRNIHRKSGYRRRALLVQAWREWSGRQ